MSIFECTCFVPGAQPRRGRLPTSYVLFHSALHKHSLILTIVPNAQPRRGRPAARVSSCRAVGHRLWGRPPGRAARRRRAAAAQRPARTGVHDAEQFTMSSNQISDASGFSRRDAGVRLLHSGQPMQVRMQDRRCQVLKPFATVQASWSFKVPANSAIVSRAGESGAGGICRQRRVWQREPAGAPARGRSLAVLGRPHGRH